jgi:hypothetical protein
MDIMNSFQHHSLHAILFIFSSTLHPKMAIVVKTKPKAQIMFFVACCLLVETLNQIGNIIVNLDSILVSCKCN